jgi:peptidoglycan hydrolase-like protein with peptidoglycan-binding domain
MGYYLYDNPPFSMQFYPNRQNGSSFGVVIHTTEGVGGDDSAENTARFISRRSDPGSYHCIVDTNSTVMLLPDEAVSFGVAAPGFNSRCWMIAIAARSSDLNLESPETQREIERLGFEIFSYWERNGVNIQEAAQFIGEEVKNRPGLAHHGDVQPWDRSDAWSRRGDREQFDQLLLNSILKNVDGQINLPTPVKPPEPSYVVIYTVGSHGPKVEEIQKTVGVTVDGIYGPETQAAVKVWQQKLGVNADGIWGPITEEATNNLFAFLSNLQDAPQHNPFFDALEDAKQQVLRQGSVGGSVKIAQYILNEKGYGLVVDGIFGAATNFAVWNFQKDNGLSVDGIIGPQTWSALFS